MSGEYERAASLLQTMANLERSRQHEDRARVLEEAARALLALHGEEVTAKVRVVVCRRCGAELPTR